jgi:DNA-nicking Smr family endonuclease
MSGSRGRRMSDSERILWREFTRGIAPLHQDSAQDATESAQKIAAQETAPPPPRAKSLPPPKGKAPPAPSPLGRRAKQRVARGRDAIDGRLDLHGLTQAEAYDALLRFLQAGQSRGARLVVVITGKGRGGEGGVLRRRVPLWLSLPEFRSLVVGFEEAHLRHGGEGALYLRLRRARITE